MFQGSCVICYIALHLYLNIFILSFYRSTFFWGGGAGGWRRVFVGVMKYFRHILTGHEIFSKVFDGSQNIFLCSILVFLFFKFRVLEHKISKLAIKPLRTFKKNMLNKSHHSADIWLIVGKIKENVCCILILMLGSLSLAIDTRYNFVTFFFSVIVIFLTPFSQV